MASLAIGQVREPRAGALLTDCVAAHGSSSHAYATGAELVEGPFAARNMADAIHFLCALHGRHPGLVETVALRSLEPQARVWLREASERFAIERAFLARLAVEVGPVPATPGSGSEAAIAVQRGALATLAQSERRGCALGAAFAFVADWGVINRVLRAAGERFGVQAAPAWRDDPAALAEAVELAAVSVSVRRAILFGAEQVALQHRGLWDLLAARAAARLAG